MSEHHWFDALLASVHVSPFAAKGDEDGFFGILSRELDNEVKGRDAGVLGEHENWNNCIDMRIAEHRLHALSVPELDPPHGDSTPYVNRISHVDKRGLISVSF